MSTSREAYYQISTDAGNVTISMPFTLSPDDAEDVVSNLEIIIRQIRRRSTMAVVEDGQADDALGVDVGNDDL